RNDPNPGGAPERSAGDEELHFESPLSMRRGQADPTDIGAGEVQTNAGMFDWDANPLEPHGAPEPGAAVAPKETFPEPSGPPGDRSPTPPKEPGTASGMTDGQQADAAFRRLGK